MFGAIIGDIVGSRFEFKNHLSKEFELITDFNFITDDSVMTLAVAQAILDCEGRWDELSERVIMRMRQFGERYPFLGYGLMFRKWLNSPIPAPYGSFGNGAAMRISPVAYAANSLEEAKDLSRKVTEVTHDHPEGIKGAEAVACAVYLARTGSDITEIQDFILSNYYDIDFELSEIRGTKPYDETCQVTVPRALEAFFESNNFEDAIRNAVSIGGDSDTIACITGAIAGAYYGVPKRLFNYVISELPTRLVVILGMFNGTFSAYKIEKRRGLKK